nr:hypothetical protein [Tanacetum cinerariifolium]
MNDQKASNEQVKLWIYPTSYVNATSLSPDLSESIDSNLLFDIVGHTLLLRRRVFSNKAKKLETKKASLGKATKGKVALPSDKGHADKKVIKKRMLRLIEDLPAWNAFLWGLDIGIIPQKLSLVVVGRDRFTRNDELGSYAGQYGGGASDIAKDSCEISTCLGLRNKYRLNLKNDMPPRDKISFNESNDEDYTVVFDNGLKTDSEIDNDKVYMPLFLSPEPTVSYFDDLDFFKGIENEFPAIVYNDALMSKLDFLTKPIASPQHIDEFDLKDETLFSECDEQEQNVLYFNDLFPFNIIYWDDLKLDKDNDGDKIDIKQSSGGNVINTDVGAYAQGSNKLLETSHDTSNKFSKAKTFIKKLNVNIMTLNHLNKGMSFIFLIKNLYVPFGIPFDPKLFYNDEIKLRHT